MAFDPLSLAFVTLVGAAGPAGEPQPGLAALALPRDRIGQPLALDQTPVTTAFLATSCRDRISLMSGIQFLTCLVANPEDLFGPADDED
jgi:hypothetical protein